MGMGLGKTPDRCDYIVCYQEAIAKCAFCHKQICKTHTHIVLKFAACAWCAHHVPQQLKELKVPQ